jgi:hypothetical protein
MAIYSYATPGDLARQYRDAIARSSYARAQSWPTEWMGGTLQHEALDYAEHGRDRYATQAEALLRKINVTLPDTNRDTWHASPMGAYPIVPAYLAGLPENMMRRSRENDETAPLLIFAGLTSSAGISARNLVERGVAILALTMAAAMVRPVQLVTMTCIGRNVGSLGSVHICHIPSAPLSLAEAGFALCDQAFSRGLGYRMAYAKDHADGGWPAAYPYGKPAGRHAYMNRVADAAGFTGDRVCIPPAELGDDIGNDPTAWLLARVAEYVHDHADSI